MSKVLVIGLDGATFRIIRPLAERGELPNLSRLMREGVSGELESTIQPSSEQAWSTFMTGLNNGKHGIFGFLQRVPGTYRMDYVNARRRAGRTLWRILSDREKHVIVLNVPMTYPPEPVNGVLIGGLLSPGPESRFTYPESVYAELKREIGGYIIDVDIERGNLSARQLEELLEQTWEMISLRTKATEYLARTRPWDFLMVVYGAPDRLSHKFWRHMDPDHPLHTPEEGKRFGHVLPDVYRRLDAEVGKLLDDLADDETTVIILSDHGFGPLYKAVYLNKWLAQNGYLTWKSGGSVKLQGALKGVLRQGLRHLDNPWLARAKEKAFALWPGLKGALHTSMAYAGVDWKRTRAYAVGTMGNVYVNLKGREPEGTVEPGPEYEALRDEIIAGLRELRDPEWGTPVFQEVHRREELYHGPYAEAGPDIVAVKDHRYHVAVVDWRGGDEVVVPLGEGIQFVSDASGQHDLYGIFIAWGHGIRHGKELQGARLVDMAPTILHALRETIPTEMDGRVLMEAFESPGEPRFVDDGSGPAAQDTPDYSPEEEEEVNRRLRGLGYLD